MPSSRRAFAAALAVPSFLALTGCGGQGNAENRNAQEVAVQFAGSVRNDTVGACALLAPQTLQALQQSVGACTKSLSAQVEPSDGPATSVQVYGKDAIVHIANDTIFLARFHDGWRITAAGCAPQPDRPYDCKVKGN